MLEGSVMEYITRAGYIDISLKNYYHPDFCKKYKRMKMSRCEIEVWKAAILGKKRVAIPVWIHPNQRHAIESMLCR